jgi:hypothetical protein
MSKYLIYNYDGIIIIFFKLIFPILFCRRECFELDSLTTMRTEAKLTYFNFVQFELEAEELAGHGRRRG